MTTEAKGSNTKEARARLKTEREQMIAALRELGVEVKVMGDAIVRLQDGQLLSLIGETGGDVDTNRALAWLVRGVRIGQEVST